MHLRNLKINDCFIINKGNIIDGINELNIIIEDNYNNLNEEKAIEFNIGSRLGEPREYLVIYNNPKYDKNPYVFILKKENGQNIITNTTDLYTFESLGDLDIRKEINKTIATGFKNLPKHCFLGINDLQSVRKTIEEYDDI